MPQIGKPATPPIEITISASGPDMTIAEWFMEKVYLDKDEFKTIQTIAKNGGWDSAGDLIVETIADAITELIKGATDEEE